MSKITIGELRDLIEHEKINPSTLFEKEDLLKDPLVELLRDKEIQRRKEEDKKKKPEPEENPFIPGTSDAPLTPEQEREETQKSSDGRRAENNNDMIPD